MMQVAQTGKCIIINVLTFAKLASDQSLRSDVFCNKNSCVVECKKLEEYFDSNWTKHDADCYGCGGGGGGSGSVTITVDILV